MSKLKTKSSAKKRFKITGSGKIKRKHAFKNHILTKKSKKRKLKFISSLWKFENLNSFENPFEYQSKLNEDSRVNPDQAFESGSYRSDDDDDPF